MKERIVITGATGQLGAYLVELAAATPRIDVFAWGRRFADAPGALRSLGTWRQVDLQNAAEVEAAVTDCAPTAIIHAAAVSSVAEALREPDRAYAMNEAATGRLATLAHARGIPFVSVSTDLVFDGASAPYDESSPTNPLSVYGKTKRAGEARALEEPGTIVARVSLLVGETRCGRPNFHDQQRQALAAGQPIAWFEDEWRTPLRFEDAAAALLLLARSNASGLFHVGGPERLSRAEMGKRLAKSWGLPIDTARVVSRLSVDAPEPRPADTSLRCEKFKSLFPTWRARSIDGA